MKFREKKDREHLLGMKIIPETEREQELLKCYGNGGIKLNSHDEQNLTFSFQL